MNNSIYRVLSQKKMTQDALAKLVGVKREYLNRIIHGKVTPRVPLGMKIAGALELSMEDVFFLEK